MMGEGVDARSGVRKEKRDFITQNARDGADVSAQADAFPGAKAEEKSRPAPFDPVTASGMQKPQMTVCGMGGQTKTAA